MYRLLVILAKENCFPEDEIFLDVFSVIVAPSLEIEIVFRVMLLFELLATTNILAAASMISALLPTT